MPEPTNFVRSCQIERGHLDRNDIPIVVTAHTLDHYIFAGGRQRRALRSRRERHTAQYDSWLKQSSEHCIVTLATIRTGNARYDAAGTALDRLRRLDEEERTRERISQAKRANQLGGRVEDLSEPSFGKDLTNV